MEHLSGIILKHPVFFQQFTQFCNKFDQLVNIIQGHVDILVSRETKLDNTFPVSQFLIGGFSVPYRLDRNSNGGGYLFS